MRSAAAIVAHQKISEEGRDAGFSRMEEAGLATSRWERAAPRLVHQRPVAILDFKHAERCQIEPEMILGRHVDHPAGADETLGLLDFVAHFGLVRRLCTLHRLDEDEQAVAHVTSEG